MTNPQYPGAGDRPGGFPPQPPSGQQQPGPYGPGQQPYAPGAQQFPPQGMPPMYGQVPYQPPSGGPYQPPPGGPYPPQPGGPYPQGAGGPYPPQPGKKRGTVVLVTLVAVMLVIGLGVGGYFLVSGGGGGGDPRAVAQQFVDGDGDDKELICASDLAKIEEAGTAAPVPTEPVTMPDDAAAKSELVGVDVPEGSDRGTFTVKTDVTVGTQSHSQTVEYDLVEEDGEWKVCGILEASEPGSSDSEEPGTSDPDSNSPDGNSPGGNSPGGSDSDAARAVAQQFVDGDGIDKGVICTADVATIELAEKSGSGQVQLPDSEYSTRKITNFEVPEGSDEGTFTLELSVKGGSSAPIKSLDYDLVQESGAWKVCGVLQAWLN